MSDSLLFSSTNLGPLSLKNRVVMGPMTRSRCIGNVPGEIVAKYYAQRAEAGLIITEGTSPSPNGLGYARIPGLYNDAQVAGWKGVTDAVHKAGSKIFVQLMHTGRIGAQENLPPGAKVFGASAVQAPGKMYTDAAGMVDHPVPQEFTDAEVESTIEEYVQSAKLAIEAGFDGVELHGANGYLIEQFLNVASNKRTDKWGGTIENRMRFAVEIAARTAKAIGAEKLGIRVSPYGVFNSMELDADTDALYLALAKKLSELGLAYIHMVDHSAQGAPKPSPELVKQMREAFKGTFILSGGYDEKRAEADLQEKRGDLVCFSHKFISNPTLVSKMKSGAALTPPDQATFYTPGEKGYTDYV